MEEYQAKYRLDGKLYTTGCFEAKDLDDAETFALLLLEGAGHKDAEIIRIERCG